MNGRVRSRGHRSIQGLEYYKHAVPTALSPHNSLAAPLNLELELVWPSSAWRWTTRPTRASGTTRPASTRAAWAGTIRATGVVSWRAGRASHVLKFLNLVRREVVFDSDRQTHVQLFDLAFRIEDFIKLGQRLLLVHV